MMKLQKIFPHFITCITIVLGIFCVGGFVTSQDLGAYNTEPKGVLNFVVDRVNDNNSDKIIRSELDRVNSDDPTYGPQNKLANTLESLRYRIAVYLQRLSFMTMVIATVLIIYNGLRLVLSPLQPDEVANVKKRMIYILLGLLVATGFYYLIKIVLSVSIQATN